MLGFKLMIKLWTRKHESINWNAHKKTLKHLKSRQQNKLIILLTILLLLLHTSVQASPTSQWEQHVLSATHSNWQHFWATVTSNSSPYAMGSLSCLSVMLVYCDQTTGWIRIPLGRPCDTVSNGDTATPTKRGISPPALFGPCLLWPNGRLSQQHDS